MQLTNIKSFVIKHVIPLIVTLSIFIYLYTPFFINESGLIGDDYSYFLPNLLSGYYWYLQNGFLNIPWFTPAFCGGLPLFPNPQSVYLSLPQLLLIWFKPEQAIYITFIVFAGIGVISAYYLLLKKFCFSWSASLLGAVIFLFNGFYLSRMIMGHLTYHVFMLIPLMSICLLYKNEASNKLTTFIVGIIFPALLFSYVIYAGAINMMVPVLISVIGVYYCFLLINKENTCFWYRFFLAGLLALLLSGAKLLPAYYFISHFPRELYTLPGFDGIISALINVGRAFFDSFNPGVSEKLVNLSFQATDMGFDFNIGILPLLILASYFFFRAKSVFLGQDNIIKFSQGRTHLYILILIVLIPVLLNTYYPYWNEFLKHLPYIKNSSLLTRWIAIDILLLIIISCFLFDKLKNIKWYGVMLTVSLGILLVEKTMTIDRYDSVLSYQVDDINNAYVSARETKAIPKINNIGAYEDANNNFVMVHARNNQMINGVSILNCYEPIFGYQLETFPAEKLVPGSVLLTNDDYINIKNPACYVFDEVNQCLPGEHFKQDEIKQALNFSSYQRFKFHMPFSAKAALIISLASFIFCFICIAFNFYSLMINRRVK